MNPPQLAAPARGASVDAIFMNSLCISRKLTRLTVPNDRMQSSVG